MDSVTVDFLIPAFNAGSCLQIAVDSALAQTYPCRVIVVDDASTDGAPSRLLPDPRVSVIRLERNVGACEAKNCGLKASTATYVAILDADDIAMPSRLQLQIPFLLAGVALVAGSAVVFDDHGDLETVWLPQDPERLKTALRSGNRIVHSTVTFDRKLALESGGYLSQWDPIEDFELITRIALSHQICAVPEVVSRYRVSPGGITDRHRRRMWALSELVCENNPGLRDAEFEADRVIGSIRHAHQIARDANVRPVDLLRVAAKRVRPRMKKTKPFRIFSGNRA